MLPKQTARSLRAVLAPKLHGLLNLIGSSADRAQIVAFSSIAGALGSAGQGNYAAANAAVDAYSAALARQVDPAYLPYHCTLLPVFCQASCDLIKLVLLTSKSPHSGLSWLGERSVTLC